MVVTVWQICCPVVARSERLRDRERWYLSSQGNEIRFKNSDSIANKTCRIQNPLLLLLLPSDTRIKTRHAEAAIRRLSPEIHGPHKLRTIRMRDLDDF